MKCENCGAELDQNCYYVVGVHVYVCSEKCHKEQVQHLLDTFHPIKRENHETKP